MFKILKSLFKALLMITGILSMIKCGKGRDGAGGKIMFNGKVVEDKNFIVLNNSFGKDSTKVYYKDHVLTSADPATFTALNEHYAMDKNKVYYCDEYRESQTYFLTKNQTVNIVDNADPASFQAIDDDYAKDKNQAFFLGNSFKVKDVASFEVVDRLFSKDKFQVYYNTQFIPKIDGTSFELINNNYAKDKDNYFIYGFPSEVISTPLLITNTELPLEILDYPFSKNSEKVFYKNQVIKNINSITAAVVGSSYIKDDKSVYYETKKIPDANPNTFRVPEQMAANEELEYYSLDDKSVFLGTNKIVNANPKTFEILDLDYCKDDKHIYFKNKIVTNVDVNSFKVHTHRHDDEDAEDKNGKYYKGIRIKK